MNIVTEVSEWREIRKELANKTIGFVPTIGNLHAGHISLCQRSRAENELTVVSIYANQAQFNQAKDFDSYPRTEAADQALLTAEGVDYLFMPSAEEMYPDGYQVQVSETELSKILEGEYRPGHFTGVLTVVMKFLNLVQPSHVYLGEKDYQQYLLISKMVHALFVPTKVIPCETIRAPDGVPLSSRNSRLSPEQRSRAKDFAKLLHGSLSPEQVTKELIELGFKVDYIAEKWGRRLGAVWVDDVRLIDNVAENA